MTRPKTFPDSTTPPASSTQPLLAIARPRVSDRLRSPRRRLLICEPRLALSASLAAEFLLSAYDSAEHAGDDSAIDGDWLLQQAAAVRETYGIDGAGQSIAVIDSGIAWDHVALGGGFGPGYRVVGGWDFAEDDAEPYDDAPAGFHGSHVAGLLAGDSEGFTGVVPGADLVSLRVFDDQGRGSLDSIESALQWVHANRLSFDNPITTVNLSLGAILNDATAAQVMGQLEDELRLLHDEGILVVAAAGNQFDPAHPDRVTYPATSEWVTAVGSVSTNGELSDFSQREDHLLVAPGAQVRSSVPDHVFGWDGKVDDFAPANGTSMAAPQVAGATALVRAAMLQVDAEADVSPARIIEHLRATAISGTDELTGLTYHRIDLQQAIDSLLAETGKPPVSSVEPLPVPPLTSADPLGLIESQTTLLQPDAWYELTASRSGLLSINADSDVQWIVRDAEGSPTESQPASAENQHDFLVQSQQKLFVQIRGEQAQSLQFTNLVEWNSGGVRVAGTAGSDQMRLSLEDSIELEVNGAQYTFPSTGDPLVIRMDGQGASDSLSLQGSASTERLVLRTANNVSVDSSTLNSKSIALTFDGFEQVDFQGGGGADLATLYDSAGNDQLKATPHAAQLTGSGFVFDIQEVPRIYVHATAGGQDTAFLYDSAGNDRLAIRPQFTSLRSEQNFNLAYGFERVYAFASAGGHDVATLYGSVGDDHMSASANSATLSGAGYFASARHFEVVEANASQGGHDVAKLYGTGDTVQWQQASGLVQFTDSDEEGGPLTRLARGFEDVQTFVGGQAIVVSPLSLAFSAASDEPQQPFDDALPVSESHERRGPLLWEAAQAAETQRGRIVDTIATIASQKAADSQEARTLAALFADFGLNEDG